MIEVRIYQCEPFEPERDFALITVDDAGQLTITSDHPSAQIRDMAILDPDTGQSLTATDDPHRWAELLPSAYRTPYMRAVITERG
jgi:hypothetical protein